MEDISETILELKRCLYWTIHSIRKICMENGNVSGYISSHNVFEELEPLPPVPKSRKPQA